MLCLQTKMFLKIAKFGKHDLEKIQNQDLVKDCEDGVLKQNVGQLVKSDCSMR
jgi:hypothetical protein